MSNVLAAPPHLALAEDASALLERGSDARAVERKTPAKRSKLGKRSANEKQSANSSWSLAAYLVASLLSLLFWTATVAWFWRIYSMDGP